MDAAVRKTRGDHAIAVDEAQERTKISSVVSHKKDDVASLIDAVDMIVVGVDGKAGRVA